MADASLDEKLRGMAEHRGLKLVKSRKRKAGTGDYGKYGLTDASGKALLGIASAGLTASPEDIEDYLRTGSADTWKASAAATPSRSAKPDPRESGERRAGRGRTTYRAAIETREGGHSRLQRGATAQTRTRTGPLRAIIEACRHTRARPLAGAIVGDRH